MKTLFYTLSFILFALVSCTDEVMATTTVGKLVDKDTPTHVLPQNKHIGTGWKLEFSDEFNDAQIDLSKWTVKDESRGSRPELGITEWFFKPEAVEERDNALVIKAKKVGTEQMYCGSVYSYKKYNMHHGYVEAHIKLADIRKSVLTAFWLQSPTMGHIDGTGNDGAEIDIFESPYVSEEALSTIHIDGYADAHQEKNFRYATPGIHDGYHVWGMLWNEKGIKIYYDGELKAEFNGTWVPEKSMDEYLYLSTVATFSNEGDFKGQPTDTWLTEAYFDYVRVWVQE